MGHLCAVAQGEQKTVMGPLGLDLHVDINYHTQVLGAEYTSSTLSPTLLFLVTIINLNFSTKIQLEMSTEYRNKEDGNV